MDGMSLLDQMISNYQNDQMETMPFIPPTTSGQAAPPTQQGGLNILDMLSQPAAPAAPLPEAEGLGMLPGLALLRFAAQFSQPKQRGQSTVGKFMESAADTAGYAMTEKKGMEDRATQRELQKRQLQKSDLDLENARMTGIKTKQNIVMDEEQRPLALEKLKLGIENAKDEKELNGLKIRAAKLKDRYAEQLAKAELDEKQAKSLTEKAEAAQRQAQARLLNRQAEELVNIANIRARTQGQPKFKVIDPVMPGGPQMRVDERTGKSYRMKMNPEDAELFAQQQAAAHARMTGMSSAEQKAFESRLYSELLRDEQIPAGEPQGQGAAAPAPSATGAPPAQASTTGAKLESALPTNRNQLMRDPTTGKHYMNGVELTEEQLARIQERMRRGAVQQQPPSVSVPATAFNQGA